MKGYTDLPTDVAGTQCLLRRMHADEEEVWRVNKVAILDRTLINDSLVAAEVEPLFAEVTSFPKLLRAVIAASGRLRRLELFDSVIIKINPGPPGLPISVDIYIEVSEMNLQFTDLGFYLEPQAGSHSVEGSLKLKNLFSCGDIWDGSVTYGLVPVSETSMGLSTEISLGMSLPNFTGLPSRTPLSARMSLRSLDGLKFRHRHRVAGFSFGLLSSGNHDVSYKLSLADPLEDSQLSSETFLSRKLGLSLFSALKYSYKIDRMDSAMRPSQGHAFVSTTQIGGFSLIRQEFDLRYAIPLGIYDYAAALNFGISGGMIFPWRSASSYLAERFYMGYNSPPVCSLRGPTSTLGFNARGLGPAGHRRLNSVSTDGNSEKDYAGGDLAVTAFADFSFDLPLRVLQKVGIYGHVFACTGGLNKLPENAYKDFSFQKFHDSFRTWAGFGIIIPTRMLQIEVNYCHILKQHEHDHAKKGFQISFSILK